MLRALAVTLTFAWSTACANEPPENWTQLGDNLYVPLNSVQRYGNTLHFATAMRFGSQGWTFGWHWAHCTKGWLTDTTSLSLRWQEPVPALAYASALADPDRVSKYSVDFGKFASPPFGDGMQLQRFVTAQCKRVGPSEDSIEIPIASTERKLGRESFVDYIMLKTIVKRGDLWEAWFRRRPVLHSEAKNDSGEVLKKDSGEPWTKDTFTEQSTLARFKASVNCSQRTLALSRFTEYDKQGRALSAAQESSKLVFEEPIPETLGEAYLTTLCRQ